MSTQAQTLPSWMTPSDRADENGEIPFALLLPDERQLEKTQFEQTFEYALGRLAEGAFIGSIIRNSPFKVHRGRFMTWVKNDSERWRRYNAAQQVGAEIIAANLADPESDTINDLPMDVNMKRINFEIGKWYLGIVDRKRFAETKQVEINQSISITAALEQANGRLIEHIKGEVIDAEENK